MGSRRHRAHRVACDVEFVTAHIVRDSGEGLICQEPPSVKDQGDHDRRANTEGAARTRRSFIRL